MAANREALRCVAGSGYADIGAVSVPLFREPRPVGLREWSVSVLGTQRPGRDEADVLGRVLRVVLAGAAGDAD
jgi:hypothetical protein